MKVENLGASPRSRVTNMNYFETRFEHDNKRTLVWEVLVNHLARKFDFGNVVLDAGCGYGDFINQVCANERWALDLNPDVKKYLHPAINFVPSGLHEIKDKISRRDFSFIFSSNVLEHLSRDHIEQFFSDAYQLLAPGGRLGILMPNYRRAFKEYFDDYTHVSPISDVSLRDWLTTFGFKIEFSHPGFMPYSVKDSRLPIQKWLVKCWLLSPWKPTGKQMLVIGQKPSK